MKTTKRASVVAILATLFFTGMAFAQTDPGVRSNTGVNAGQPFASVSANANDLAFFQTGLGQFNEHQTVTGDNPGLGPRFNLDSCGACHSQPAAGGTVSVRQPFGANYGGLGAQLMARLVVSPGAYESVPTV